MKKSKWIYVLFAVLGSFVGTILITVLLKGREGLSAQDLIFDCIASGIGATFGCLVFVKKMQKEEK